jgi:hypothetical protein
MADRLVSVLLPARDWDMLEEIMGHMATSLEEGENERTGGRGFASGGKARAFEMLRGGQAGINAAQDLHSRPDTEKNFTVTLADSYWTYAGEAVARLTHEWKQSTLARHRCQIPHLQRIGQVLLDAKNAAYYCSLNEN